MSSKLKSWLLFCFVTIISLEFASWVLLKGSFFLHELPSYRWTNVEKRFLQEINPQFGVWHPANSTYEHRRACFNVTYESNSYGMRDPERSLHSEKPRTVVLGDSFIEGFGLPYGQRITDFLEKNRKKEHLNFGAASMGPLQYYLVYKNIAKNFDHDEVLVGLYPKNDFMDMNNQFHQGDGRYVPFLKGSYPHFEIFYSAAHPRGNQLSTSALLKGAFKEFTYAYNAGEYIYWLVTYKLRERKQMGEKSYSWFYNFKDEDWDRLRFSMESLLQEATGKKVIFLLFPSPVDLETFKQLGSSPLEKKFQEWIQEMQAKQFNTQIISLLPALSRQKDLQTLYNYPCDRHFSAQGSAYVAQEIQKQLSQDFSVEVKSQSARRP